MNSSGAGPCGRCWCDAAALTVSASLQQQVSSWLATVRKDRALPCNLQVAASADDPLNC